MLKLNLNLPLYRVRVQVAPKRHRGNDQFLALVNELLTVRFGSRISRAIRFVLEHIHLKRILGVNLVGMALAANTINTTGVISVNDTPTEMTTLPATDSSVKTIVVRRYPINGRPVITQGYHLFHNGVDIDGVTGDPIYPLMNGKVAFVGKDFFLGNKVVVDHEDDYESVYGHLNKTAVKTGQEVTTATKLGEMGNTGRSFGDHLHLEVYKNGRNTNPFTVLPAGNPTFNLVKRAH
ncbi:M23 family metallopeptidase [Candidatus Microgenomates bacterium]|nr:M23 family metallopeptidase [Candidatus Microgenomates bacterium]